MSFTQTTTHFKRSAIHTATHSQQHIQAHTNTQSQPRKSRFQFAHSGSHFRSTHTHINKGFINFSTNQHHTPLSGSHTTTPFPDSQWASNATTAVSTFNIQARNTSFTQSIQSHSISQQGAHFRTIITRRQARKPRTHNKQHNHKAHVQSHRPNAITPTQQKNKAHIPIKNQHTSARPEQATFSRTHIHTAKALTHITDKTVSRQAHIQHKHHTAIQHKHTIQSFTTRFHISAFKEHIHTLVTQVNTSQLTNITFNINIFKKKTKSHIKVTPSPHQQHSSITPSTFHKNTIHSTATHKHTHQVPRSTNHTNHHSNFTTFQTESFTRISFIT